MTGLVYIVCGGTGGHLAPGVATAQRLREHGVDVRLMVSEKEVDSRLLASYPDLPCQRVKGAPFGLHPAILLRFVYCSLFGFIQAFRLLRLGRPGALVAFGGYLSASFVIAARLLRIPVVLHEANRKVGRSIRSLADLADMVFLPEGVELDSADPSHRRSLGMPLRREVRHIIKDEIRQQLDIPLHAKVVCFVGGSQGAEAINKWVERHRRSLCADGLWIFLVAGPGKQQLPDVEVFESDAAGPVEARSFAFHNALHELFSASDIVVSRAGAGTVAELVACLTPSILIPYPHAADQHQLANARDLERRGGCIVLGQDQISMLYREILDLAYNDWLLSRMRQNLRRIGRGDAASELAGFIIERYLGGKHSVPSPNPTPQDVHAS